MTEKYEDIMANKDGAYSKRYGVRVENKSERFGMSHGHANKMMNL